MLNSIYTEYYMYIFLEGTQHTSDNHLNGYFSLHRLFLWAIKTYPELQQKIDDRLAVSID